MESRRSPRTIIDPKIRQVGFFTSCDPPPVRSDTGNSTTIPSSTSPPTANICINNTSLSRDVRMPIGGGGSDVMEFCEEVAASGCLRNTWSGKAARSFPWSKGELKMAVKSCPNATTKSALTTASVVKTLPVVIEKDGETSTEKQNEGTASARSKQKTTKGERRAIQEVQRAVKASAMDAGKKAKSTANAKHAKGAITSSQTKDGPQGTAVATERRADRNPDKDRKKYVPQPSMQFDDKALVEKAKKTAVVSQFEARNRVELFRHLPQYEHRPQLPYLESRFFHLDHIHPSVYKVGLQYLTGSSTGGNARCKEMLLAFKEAIMDYYTPPEKTLVRDLTSKISSYVSFLIECRPLSISMGNAIRFLKNRIAKLDHNISESEAKSNLLPEIDRFINEKIIIADKVIVHHAVTKIRDGDVLLIYGHSTVVEMILLQAHELGKQFRIVIVDSRPKLEGQTLLQKLVMKGLSCTYTHLNAISYIMHHVSRVFLGASSVFSNGTVYSRVGTACVAMVSHAFGVPVIICCEAYKFHERVLVDSVCSNELGDPDVISMGHEIKGLNHMENFSEHENIQFLNLVYDATPSDYVSMIVTEHGMIPPSSVPVIFREYGSDQLFF